MNKKLYEVYSILKKSLPIWFVFLIYLKGKGLSYAEALFLDSVSAGVAMFFEVPSGILADYKSKKWLIWYGELFITFNYLLLLFGKSYYIFLIGAVLSGLGEACISGTGEALLYDSFKNESIESEYTKYVGKISKLGLRFAAVSTLTASFLYNINKEVPMIISLLFQCISLVIIIFFKDVKINEEKPESNLISEFKKQWKNIRYVLTNESLIKFFLIYLIMLEIISNLNYSSQTFLPQLGLNIKFLGLVFFVFNIIASFGAKKADKIKMNAKKIIIIYGILLIGLSISNLFFAIVFLGYSRYINGFIWPLLSGEINQQIPTGDRATILSYKSLFCQVFPLFIDPIIGILFDFRGIRFSYALMGILLLLFVLIYCIIKKSN